MVIVGLRAKPRKTNRNSASNGLAFLPARFRAYKENLIVARGFPRCHLSAVQIHLAFAKGTRNLHSQQPAVPFAHLGHTRDSEPAIQFRRVGNNFHLAILTPLDAWCRAMGGVIRPLPLSQPVFTAPTAALVFHHASAALRADQVDDRGDHTRVGFSGQHVDDLHDSLLVRLAAEFVCATVLAGVSPLSLCKRDATTKPERQPVNKNNSHVLLTSCRLRCWQVFGK